MQTCQAYQSCPVCTHAWSPPLSRGCVADGYRRFLEMGDPGRQRKVKYKGLCYEYKDACARKVPKTRDTEFVQSVCAVATVKKPWLGHKFAPVLSRLPGFDWQRLFGAPEVMHGIYVNVMFAMFAHNNVNMCLCLNRHQKLCRQFRQTSHWKS